VQKGETRQLGEGSKGGGGRRGVARTKEAKEAIKRKGGNRITLLTRVGMESGRGW